MGRVPEPILAQMAHKLVDGLCYLHEEVNVIHLDLKPENVLCSLNGEVKISDFGTSSQNKNNADGRVSSQGTLQYMSPERIDG